MVVYFTLRDRELPAFRLYRMRSRSQRLLECNSYEVLLDLFETKIEQLADVIEKYLCRFGRVKSRYFKRKTR